MEREAEFNRKTKEVDINVKVDLDGQGAFKGKTRVRFLDHMLEIFAKHSGIDLEITAKGDLKHHIIEDLAICIGGALSKALGDRIGVKRFGYAFAPMDDSLARAVVDLGGRSYTIAELGLMLSAIEDFKQEDFEHFLRSLAENLKANLHLHVIYGLNDHHKAEASIKALALAMRDACTIVGNILPSTKGTL